MKKQYSFLGYLLIGLGIFFLLRQLKVPILTNFYSWTTLIIILGIILLIYSLRSKDYQHLFSGTFLLGLGIHLHGLEHYSFWISHWAVYLLLVGIAFFVRFLKTKRGFLLSVSLILLSLLFILSDLISNIFPWANNIFDVIGSIWPVILIIIGIYLLVRRKK